jgi:hypothetical protein
MLTAPGERRLIRGGEVHAHHPEARMQEPFRLRERQVEQKTERQCGFDGDAGVISLPSPSADARGPRWRSPPVTSTERLAASDEGTIVEGPLCDAVLGLVRGIDSRIHPFKCGRGAQWIARIPLFGPVRPEDSCTNAAYRHRCKQHSGQAERIIYGSSPRSGP